MSPWTEAEVAAVEDLFAICDHLDPVHPNAKVIDPLNPKTSFLSPAFFSGDLPEESSKANGVSRLSLHRRPALF